MKLASREVGGVTVVDVIGRLTSTDGSGRLEAQIAELVKDGRTQVVLNLSRLNYMDSSGLGEMIASYTTITKAGGAIRLCETTTRIQDLLSITRLVTVFDCFDTEALAVASFEPAVALEPHA